MPLAVILRGGVVPIRERDPFLPDELANVIDRALMDDPAQRYPDAGGVRTRRSGRALVGMDA